MTLAIFSALSSYLRVRCFPHKIRNRASLAAWQKKQLANWLKNDLPKVKAFSEYGDQTIELSDLPIMEKSDLMTDFARYNNQNVTNEQGWAAFETSKQIGDFIVGASTGTSGNRGLFVISQIERFKWLGTILAKAIPTFWRQKNRIAVLLPIDTPLYDSANHVRLLEIKFFDINLPLKEISAELEAFNPTILIAPPRILRRFCETPTKLLPRLLFSAAEKLEEFDREIIEHKFGAPLREIYMATEGLLGVSCSHNKLHLCEDCMHFEFMQVGENLVSPVISDFSRKTQIMARYRLNDLLRLDSDPCPCGSPLIVVSEIIGRQDDVFSLIGQDGKHVEITPDILRNVIVDTDRDISDFRLLQTGPLNLELQLPDYCSFEVNQLVRERLNQLLGKHGVSPDVKITHTPVEPQTARKLRRVERCWFP
ncbi:F390 synthetase-related protein [Lentilitoribacter sp. Alg239-R112]|uniref:F390 synthetase-related protein n=1 Tax=Lentilitoribacter sp. Alg239-R112 TaxID=2305987 RepID=UPI0013A6C3A1|nr:F390 synthetase-related protein [Lentilitoribacter sp. Alg239-R112]